MPEEVKKSLIGDLAGLSEPLKKLVEVVSSGVGRLTGTVWLDKRDADNEAYKILKVGGAQTQVVVDRMKAVGAIGSGSTPQIRKLTLAGNEINAELSDGQQAVLALKERGNSRIEYQNLLHQFNIEQTVKFAAEQLETHDAIVSEQPVDNDWITRLFSIIENVSSEEMQALWGKVLSGEIKAPGSFSLRTVEVLKNLSSDEAHLFKSLCGYLLTVHEAGGVKSYSLVRSIGADELGVDKLLTYTQIVLLSDCGLVHIDSGTRFELDQNDYIKDTIRAEIRVGNKVLLVEDGGNKKNSPSLECYALTKAGSEISQLVDAQEVVPAFIKEIGQAFLKSGFHVKYADFINHGKGDWVVVGELFDFGAYE